MQALKDHLRLGTGFADDGLQDGLLEGYLRAAMAAIEGRIGKALIARGFKLTLEDWRGAGEQALPVAPVSAVAVGDAGRCGGRGGGGRRRRAIGWCRTRTGRRLAATGGCLPAVPTGGRVEVVFDAGFGAGLGRRAGRSGAGGVAAGGASITSTATRSARRAGGCPSAVQALIERWRTVRVLGGGAA